MDTGNEPDRARHKKPSIRLCYARPRSTSIRWNSEARVARLNVHSTRDLEPWLPEPSWTMDNTARCQNLKILDGHPPTGIPVKMLQLGYLYLEVASPHLLPTMRSSPCGSPGPCVSAIAVTTITRRALLSMRAVDVGLH